MLQQQQRIAMAQQQQQQQQQLQQRQQQVARLQQGGGQPHPIIASLRERAITIEVRRPTICLTPPPYTLVASLSLYAMRIVACANRPGPVVGLGCPCCTGIHKRCTTRRKLRLFGTE
jgi:hypothetical protein